MGANKSHSFLRGDRPHPYAPPKKDAEEQIKGKAQQTDKKIDPLRMEVEQADKQRRETSSDASDIHMHDRRNIEQTNNKLEGTKDTHESIQPSESDINRTFTIQIDSGKSDKGRLLGSDDKRKDHYLFECYTNGEIISLKADKIRDYTTRGMQPQETDIDRAFQIQRNVLKPETGIYIGEDHKQPGHYLFESQAGTILSLEQSQIIQPIEKEPIPESAFGEHFYIQNKDKREIGKFIGEDSRHKDHYLFTNAEGGMVSIPLHAIGDQITQHIEPQTEDMHHYFRIHTSTSEYEVGQFIGKNQERPSQYLFKEYTTGKTVSLESAAITKKLAVEGKEPHETEIGQYFHIRMGDSIEIGEYLGTNPDNPDEYLFTHAQRDVISLQQADIIDYKPQVGMLGTGEQILPEDQFAGKSHVRLSEADLSGTIAYLRLHPEANDDLITTNYDQESGIIKTYAEYLPNKQSTTRLGINMINGLNISKPEHIAIFSKLAENAHIHFQMPRVPRGKSEYSTQRLVKDILRIPQILGRPDITISITVPDPEYAYKGDLSTHNRFYGILSGKALIGTYMERDESLDQPDELTDELGYTHKQTTTDTSTDSADNRKTFYFKFSPIKYHAAQWKDLEQYKNECMQRYKAEDKTDDEATFHFDSNTYKDLYEEARQAYEQLNAKKLANAPRVSMKKFLPRA